MPKENWNCLMIKCKIIENDSFHENEILVGTTGTTRINMNVQLLN